MNEGFPSTNKSIKSEDSEIVTPITPQFIREFSRENSPEERDEVAAEIREKRRERDAFRVEQNELSAEQEKLVAELNELRDKIEEYNSSGFLQKITDYLEYRQLQTSVAEQLEAQGKVEQALQELGETPLMFAEPKRLLEEFYQGEKEKWAEAGYTKEDIQEHFSEENLSKLTVEEYALLMRRFPGEMVTHVTRQGIRDHNYMRNHSVGLGEKHDGFKDILMAGKLQSALGIALQEHTKEEAVASFLELDRFDKQDGGPDSPRDRAIAMFKNTFVSNSTTGHPFEDKSAVHVASENVLNAIYGGETGNEVFIAYPSAYVASQHSYGGKGSLVDSGWNVHNDKSIYTENNKGLSLDTGLVFIPEEAAVDAETGSRYKIDEKGEPVFNKKIDEILKARFEQDGFIQTFVQQLPVQLEFLVNEERMKVAEEAFQKFGITDPDAKKALLEPIFIEIISEMWGTETESTKYGESLGDYFGEDLKSIYQLAESTVTSRDYWEKYFTDNPEQRPSKIVYYKGSDPSKALNDWRKKNGIVKNTADDTFGFPEHRLNEGEYEAGQDVNALKELALKIIDDRFPESEAEASVRIAKEGEWQV